MDINNKFLMIILVVLIFILGFSVNGWINSRPNGLSLFNYKDNINCSGMSLLMTSKCLIENVDKFYKYNISNLGKSVSLEQLKVEGGTCKTWTDYYIDNFKGLGFKGKEIDFFGENNSIGHAVALIYTDDLNSYCIIDQNDLVGCAELLVDKKEVKQ